MLPEVAIAHSGGPDRTSVRLTSRTLVCNGTLLVLLDITSFGCSPAWGSMWEEVIEAFLMDKSSVSLSSVLALVFSILSQSASGLFLSSVTSSELAETSLATSELADTSFVSSVSTISLAALSRDISSWQRRSSSCCLWRAVSRCCSSSSRPSMWLLWFSKACVSCLV